MQEIILPISCGMTVERAICKVPNVKYQATNEAVYFDMLSNCSEENVQSLKNFCPNCNAKAVPIVHWSKENVKLIEAGEVILAPGAYDNPGVPYGNLGCLKCGYRWSFT